jgi:hypothetical protein
MLKINRAVFIAVFLSVLTCVATCFGASTGTVSTFDSTLVAYTPPLFADFDSDNKIDQAELVSNGVHKSIHIALGTYVWKSLSFDSGETDRGQLLSEDIDHDGDTDLIWISQTQPKTLVAWLGDGRGNFSVVEERDQQRIEALFNADRESRLTDDPDASQPAGVLLPPGSAAIQSAAHRFSVVSSQSSVPLSEPAAFCAICLSVYRKRGPPLKLF